MGIPEQSLNKVADSIKFAININYLPDSRKSARAGADSLRRRSAAFIAKAEK
jgi:hypothetical protein